MESGIIRRHYKTQVDRLASWLGLVDFVHDVVVQVLFYNRSNFVGADDEMKKAIQQMLSSSSLDYIVQYA